MADPVTPFTEEEILKHARDVVTNTALFADANDPDWGVSLMLLLSGWQDMPPHLSSLFIVPLAPHMGGRWLNRRVPGVTISCVAVPRESVVPLLAKTRELHTMLYPEANDGTG